MSILNNNHEILSALLQSGRTVWITPLVEAMGFKPDYFTKLVEIKSGSIRCECFDIRYEVSKTKLSRLMLVTDHNSSASRS